MGGGAFRGQSPLITKNTYHIFLKYSISVFIFVEMLKKIVLDGKLLTKFISPYFMFIFSILRKFWIWLHFLSIRDFSYPWAWQSIWERCSFWRITKPNLLTHLFKSLSPSLDLILLVTMTLMCRFDVQINWIDWDHFEISLPSLVFNSLGEIAGHRSTNADVRISVGSMLLCAQEFRCLNDCFLFSETVYKHKYFSIWIYLSSETLWYSNVGLHMYFFPFVSCLKRGKIERHMIFSPRF